MCRLSSLGLAVTDSGVCTAETMAMCTGYLQRPVNHTEPAAQSGIHNMRVQLTIPYAERVSKAAPSARYRSC